MKRKLSKILGIGLTLALLTSLLVTGVPVAASPDIDQLALTVTPNITDAGGYYQLIFQIHDGMEATTDNISVRFPVGTTLPTTLAFGDGKVKLTTAGTEAGLAAAVHDNPTDITITDQTITMWLPAWGIPAEDWAMVEFGGRTVLGNCDDDAGIMNPDTAGTYTLYAWTCEEQAEVGVNYDILEPPGPVDIYEKHLGELVDCALPYFIYRDSEDTIQEAIDATDILCAATPGAYDAVAGQFVGYRLVVHDGTYPETIKIDVPGLIVESMNGALLTIIDASGLDPEGHAESHHCAAVMIAAEGVTFGGTGKGFTIKNAGVGVDSGGIGPLATLWADENSDGIADVSGVYIWPNYGVDAPDAAAVSDPDRWCRVNVIDNLIYNSTGCGIRTDGQEHGSWNWPVSVYIGDNTIYDNQFDGFHGDDLTSGPTWVDPGYTYLDASTSLVQWGNTAIVGNEFYGNGGTGNGIWEIDGQYTNDGDYPSWVSENWIDAGILIGSTIAAQDEPSGETCYIVDNDIHNNIHAGICLNEHAADGDLIVIKRNAIYDNDIFGIANKATAASGSPSVINVDCRHNDIYGNTHWGIKNFVVPDDYFEAKENYWGALGGPSLGPAPIRHETDQCSLALGNGDAVSHWVYYNPWLSVTYVDVVDEGIRYYGSDTLTLQAGWNTLSVPLALYTSADTLNKITGLGSFLDDLVTAYAYDTAAGNWVVAPDVGDLELETGRGFYIKMAAGSNFPVLYSNQLGLPAFVLDPGWNLIGAAFGIDKDAAETDEQGRYAVANPDKNDNDDPVDADAEAEMGIAFALDSIGAQASVVVSPSVPGQLGDPWSEIWSDTAQNDMYVGEAYWAFITGTGTVTLAGWEITPFYFTPPSIP